MTDLSERRFLVTGGSSGIGLELARLLRASGAKTAIVGRDRARLDRAAREHGLLAFAADLARPEEIERVAGEVLDALGGLDGLVNNAGRGARARVEEIEAGTFHDVLATNLVAPALLLRAVLPALEAARGADVVNVGSTASLRGFPGGSIYAASKFGLRALSECWQAELRPRDIRVFHVNPSEVQTPFGGRPDTDRVPNKLFAIDIAQAILGLLTLDRRAFAPEISIWATNPFGDGSR